MKDKQIAVYARTSKEFKGVERISISQQVEDGQRLAKTKKLDDAAATFIDADRSGKLPPRQWAEGQRKTREGLSALIDAIQQGKIHTVIVRKIDRLARGTELTLRLLRLMEAHQVRLVATDEQLPASDDDSGMFTLTVLAAAAEYELKKTSSNIRRALAHAKRNGRKHGSARDLGFKDGNERGKVEIDTKSAEVVREVFSRFIAGESLNSIAKWLTMTVAQWRGREGYNVGHISRILRNPHYIGMREYEGRLEPSTVYPAIVDPATFWKAQEILKTRKGVHILNRKKQEPHLLSGLLKCGCCGRNLRWSGTGSKLSARCLHRHAKPFQQFRMTETAWLEWAESFFCPLFKVNHEPTPNPERALLMTKLAKIQDNISGLQRKFAAGNLNADLLMGALELAAEERDKVQRQLDAMPPSCKPVTKPWADMRFDERRASLLFLVERIAVFPDRVVVRYQPGTRVTAGEDGQLQHCARPDQTFPLMLRRPVGYIGKPMNCLTPFKLKPRDAYAVMTFDKTAVNWQPYICDRRGDRDAYKSVCQFYYGNPDHAKVAPPSDYGWYSRKTPEGWKKERPKRTFDDAKADGYHGANISDSIGVNVGNLVSDRE